MRRWRWSKICGAWDPPEGMGRDTHICKLVKGHSSKGHLCQCGAMWRVVAQPECGCR